ncbi:glycosyltransferase [Actinomadura madurae]|nr:glycosyltransferase [Actinomadura madurae]
MTRVLHVITGLEHGGAERQLALLLRHLPVACEVATLTRTGTLGAEIRRSGVPVHEIGMRGNRDLAALPRLARLIRRGRYDVVHTHLYRACVYGRIAARMARRAPRHRHRALPRRRPHRGTARRPAASGRSTGRPSGSGPRRSRCRPPSRPGCAAGACRPAGSPSSRTASTRPRSRSTPPAAPRPAAASGSARPSPSSARSAARPDQALRPADRGGRAARRRPAAAGRRGPGARGAGTAGARPARRRPRDLRRGTSDVAGALAAMDVLAAPSVQETFGLGVLEALAAGLPVRYTVCPALDGLPPGAAPQARRLPTDAGIWSDELARVLRAPRDRTRVPPAVARYAIAERAAELARLYRPEPPVRGAAPIRERVRDAAT